MSTITSPLMSGSMPLSPLRAGSAGDPARAQANPQEAARVAEDFESVFASLLLKEMRKTLEPGSMFGEDSGDVYGGLFDLYLGQQMSQSGGFGLAKMVREGLQRTEGFSAEQSSAEVPAETAHAIEG